VAEGAPADGVGEDPEVAPVVGVDEGSPADVGPVVVPVVSPVLVLCPGTARLT
jgi:hypothetical protein